jgi:enoyl-CoA hydratase
LQEYRLVSRCLCAPDFREGVRALLVDKDNSSQWKPPTLAEVTHEAVVDYFHDLGEYELKLNFD